MKIRSKHKSIHIIALLWLSMLSASTWAQGQARAAEDVINRWTRHSVPVRVLLNLQKDSLGCDRAVCSASSNGVVVEASSGTAACRAFYQWAKSHHAGIACWNGRRFCPPQLASDEVLELSTPFRNHQYLNVVTYGYSMPFWDQERWDQEIDWMALHGIDMPLMLLGQEWVMREVLHDMGLSDEELDAWEVGPAHLPWMRMGNLAGNSFDGPLGPDWHRRQMALAHHVIHRMRQLGMNPICPAFGGFVPGALAKHFDVTLDTTGWDWMPSEYRNYRIRPDSPLFAEIGTRFIQKWEQHFGKGTFYLSDSFNEMVIPSDTSLMAQYGQAVYQSLSRANKDAVWVMQGWTLGYQRWQWGNGIFHALISRVPQGHFYLLDMATDYNCCFWHNSFDWEFYNGFDGQPWLWSVIPNMGGKNAFTGVMEHYANGRIDAQMSPQKGHLVGFGMAPEGLDNNEIIYELLCDAAWADATSRIDLQDWTRHYLRCRYGVIPAIEDFYLGLLQSVYSRFHDHPQFGWQVRNNIIGRGSVDADSTFCDLVERLLQRKAEVDAAASLLDSAASQLLNADLIEILAMYMGAQVEDLNAQIASAVQAGFKDEAHQLLSRAEQKMLALDSLLDHHPTHRLDLWEQMAASQASSPEESARNVANARRIVSVWLGNHQADEPVNDYSCRLWSGLIRDYYLPRMLGTWLNIIDGTPWNQIDFENSFVLSRHRYSPSASRP